MLQHIDELIRRLHPGATEIVARPFGVDEGSADTTEKGIGYGKPLRVTFLDGDGEGQTVVLHTAIADHFGHDRRSDRADEMLLAYDTFREIPHHVRAIDVGFIETSGHLRSVRDSEEFYLVTEFAPGTIYAEDLRAIAARQSIDDRDRRRCDQLADCLVEIHSHRGGAKEVYTRAIRDLVGHGEGIFGMIDDFSPDVPAAPPARLQAIEKKCVEWRWRLKDRSDRLTLTHGDFHPFNLIFDDSDRLALLDAARGCHGDAADDVVCLALNYVFFAVGHDGAWAGALGDLWKRFWDRYLTATGDHELLAIAPPFVAWRALVMADPNWYPAVSANSRDALLTLVETALDAGEFDPASAEALFR